MRVATRLAGSIDANLCHRRLQAESRDKKRPDNELIIATQNVEFYLFIYFFFFLTRIYLYEKIL